MPLIADVIANQFSSLEQSVFINGKNKSVRQAKLEYRNNKILEDLHAGVTKDKVCEEYRISRPQLNRIIRDVEKEAEVWYSELTKRHALAIHNINCKNFLQVIRKLELKASELETKEDEFDRYTDCLMKIAKLRKDYDELIADGAVLRRVKELDKEDEDS